MLFGQNKLNFTICTLLILGLISSCKTEKTPYLSFITPEGGSKISSGTAFVARIDFPKNDVIDSVQYFIDATLAGSRKDTAGLAMETSALTLGSHVLAAKVFRQETIEEVTTNIIMVAAKAPIEYGFKIKNTFPHDARSYVEGLEFHDGVFYESAGQYKESSIRKVALATGKVLQETKVGDQYFAEGLTVIGNKVIQLTYKEKVGFVYDKTSLKQIGDFGYAYADNREGWGLCFDGETIYNSTGQSTIYLLDRNTYQQKGTLEVYDHNGPVNLINELEWIEGKIYANVYAGSPYANKILIIDPKTGALEAIINLIGLHPQPENIDNSDYILNGIAWDKGQRRLFVTGKYWPKLFEIEKIAR